MRCRMNLPICLCAALIACLLAIGTQTVRAANPGQLAATIEGNALNITIDGQPFTTYHFGDDEKYPHFWPVIGPASGQSVTTRYTEPYPHHRSLFFACDRVNGGNYWQEGNERGQIVSQRPEIEQDPLGRLVFTDRCLWRQPGQEPVIEDRRRVTIIAPGSDLRLIDFEITLEPLVEVTIERTNHSLFSARMTPELSAQAGGTMVNAAGLAGEQATFGVESPWMACWGKRADGKTEGLAIVQCYANRWYPAKWFTRDYGFISPTPMQWLEGDKLTLPKGKAFTLSYRVAVFAGDNVAKFSWWFRQK